MSELVVPRADGAPIASEVMEGVARSLQQHVDDWVNTLTGLGEVTYDKRLAMQVTDLGRLAFKEYEWLYHTDDIAATIVDRIVDDAMRGGVGVTIYTADGPQDEKAMVATKDRVQALRILERVSEGLVWGRLYGGALDILGVDDGAKPDQPLNPDGVKAFRFHHVVDLQSVTVARTYARLLEPNYGEHELYRVMPETFVQTGVEASRGNPAVDRAEQLVHESRTVRFRGARTSRRRQFETNQGWDDSVLRKPWEVIRDFASVWGNAALALHDMSRPVLKVPRLFESMGNPQGASLLEARVKAAQLLSSMSRFMVIDGAEELLRDGPQLTGLADLLDRFMVRLAAAARMPVTILMGRSPAGENATGESDMRSWYDQVRAFQRDIVRPILERLMRLLFKAKDGPTKGVEPERWELHFAPLEQPSAKEQAEIQLAVAQADDIWIEHEVIRREEATLSHMRPEGFNVGYVVDLEARRKALKENPDLPEPDDDAEEDPPPPPEDDDEDPEPEE